MNAQDIIRSIDKPIDKSPGDYFVDGLLYCGKCHEPKQCRPLNGSEMITNCLCRCGVRERERKEDERKAAERERLRERCLPRTSMHKSRFETAEQVDHIQKARKYIENWDRLGGSNRGTGLIFWGNVGTGKSFAAQCIANALIDRGKTVKYITAANLIEELTDAKTDYSAKTDTLCDVPLLIVDDIGAERDTAFAREKLCSAIDSRIESGKPLIVTTNYSMEDMKNCSDVTLQRIFDRLLGCCVPIQVVGESRRKKAAADNLRYARSLLCD